MENMEIVYYPLLKSNVQEQSDCYALILYGWDLSISCDRKETYHEECL